ncbi:MAG: hypothetical protein NT047_05090 [Deltaproteobacteria bacterium]|nr:hypothetical protein [Deltaproteobacteria bacterium]
MKKWIRWQGIAAFVVVSALLAGVWGLVVDRVIKGIIEKAGTKAVGAKVELGAADLSLFPLGLTLNRLPVTDPDEPMTNAVEITRVAGSLDGLKLPGVSLRDPKEILASENLLSLKLAEELRRDMEAEKERWRRS